VKESQAQIQSNKELLTELQPALDLKITRKAALETKLGVSWEKFPRKLASPSSNGSISASNCWRPLTVNFLIDSDPTQL
jgi:hypothetical protein